MEAFWVVIGLVSYCAAHTKQKENVKNVVVINTRRSMLCIIAQREREMITTQEVCCRPSYFY